MHHILIVDDSSAAVAALKSQIDASKFMIHTASSAKDAFTLLENTIPDCILTDYEMPEITGPEFCRMIKLDTRLQHVPVIVLTSLQRTEYLLSAIESGADDFLSKDSDVRIINAKIKAMIRIKSFQDELTHLRRVEGIKQIIATYNHEFNNPLTIAIGNLNWLKKNVTKEDEKARVDLVGEALDRMVGLVKKIRELRDFVESNYALGETMVAVGTIPSDKK
jgi:CheY-like chemotaxis protein